MADETGRKGIAIECDITKGGQAKSAVDRTLSTFGKIDILVNNEGGLGGAPSIFYSLTCRMQGDVRQGQRRRRALSRYGQSAFNESKRERKEIDYETVVSDLLAISIGTLL
jgi:NAD(P)-dependent dehydrogenase (short-subunit alcohol dehydrogenase family)